MAEDRPGKGREITRKGGKRKENDKPTAGNMELRRAFHARQNKRGKTNP